MPDQELPKALPLYFTLNSMKWMYYGQGEPGFIVKQTKTRLGGYDALADPYKNGVLKGVWRKPVLTNQPTHRKRTVVLVLCVVLA